MWRPGKEVTEAFLYIVRHPHFSITVEAQHFQPLKRFTKTNDLESVNKAQRELLCQQNRTIDNIPPTQDNQSYSGTIWDKADKQ